MAAIHDIVPYRIVLTGESAPTGDDECIEGDLGVYAPNLIVDIHIEDLVAVNIVQFSDGCHYDDCPRERTDEIADVVIQQEGPQNQQTVVRMTEHDLCVLTAALSQYVARTNPTTYAEILDTISQQGRS